MDMTNINWSLVQAFLAVAEKGSLSGAARDLGASQPTLGRQIKALEAQLGAELFRRQPRGLALTDAGADLVPHARAMRDAVHHIALSAAGQQAKLAGTVRITASVFLSTYQLPPIIAAIRAAEPEIAIELAPSDDTRNLIYREADIAIRMYRPTQLDLVTRHLGDLELAVYAAKTYIARRGMPQPDTFTDHDFVGYDANPAIINGFADGGITVDHDFFQTRCDDQIAYWNLVRAGCGIGFCQASIGAADPEVTRIELGFPLPTLPVWLTAHEAMRQTPRIRRVWELLAQHLAPVVS